MSASAIINHNKHRPWPLPTGPWVMRQQWLDLLFAHWPIPAETMRSLVPPALALDTWDGMAWVGVVPFRMQGVRPRLFPAVPWLSAFPELNVRTYVKTTENGITKTGVYFFSLEAANPVAVAIARSTFKLPYFNADMTLRDDGRQINYTSRRTHRGAPPANFAGTYGPIGSVYRAQPGTIDQWLTERYALYTLGRANEVYIGEIHHIPWPLQPAQATIATNTVAQASNITLPDSQPLLHFARQLDVLVWPLRPLAKANQPASAQQS